MSRFKTEENKKEGEKRGS